MMESKKTKKMNYDISISEASVIWGLCIQERLHSKNVKGSEDHIKFLTKIEKKFSKVMTKETLKFMTDLFENSVEKETLGKERCDCGN